MKCNHFSSNILPDYAKFTEFLEDQNESVSLNFEDIEKIIGKLSSSAYNHKEWWSNHPSHPLMKVVLNCGWKQRNLDLFLKKVEFYPVKNKQIKSKSSPEKDSIKSSPELLQEIDDLIVKKKELSKINLKIHSNAVLLALQHLKEKHPDVKNWETKLGSDSGVDIIGDEDKVVGEIKSTIPYGGNRLGAAQATSIKHDLDKMKKYHSASKYFFILDSVAKTAVIHKFQNELNDIKVLAIKEIFK